MTIHADLLLNVAKEHHRDLIAEGDRARLLSQARAARLARKAKPARGQPTKVQAAGTLASCEPAAVVPAR